jgi:hypothetical protein
VEEKYNYNVVQVLGISTTVFVVVVFMAKYLDLLGAAPVIAGTSSLFGSIARFMLLPQVFFIALFASFMVYSYLVWDKPYLGEGSAGLTYGQVFLMNTVLFFTMLILAKGLVGLMYPIPTVFVIVLLIFMYNAQMTALMSNQGYNASAGMIVTVSVAVVGMFFCVRRGLRVLSQTYVAVMVLGIAFVLGSLLATNAYAERTTLYD